MKFWIKKKLREEDALCDLTELSDDFIGELIREMSLRNSDKDSDSKLYYPDAFNACDYKNWIKKVSNYLDSRKGKAGVPLSYVIRPVDADPDDAPDEYTRALWAALHETPQYPDDNREVITFSRIFSLKQTERPGLRRLPMVTVGRRIYYYANTTLEKHMTCDVPHLLMPNLKRCFGKVKPHSHSRNI